MKAQEGYWSYKAPPTPELHDLPTGAFAGTERGFNSLTPGMRREIYRSAMKKVEEIAKEDGDRLERADTQHAKSEVQIKARETI